MILSNDSPQGFQKSRGFQSIQEYRQSDSGYTYHTAWAAPELPQRDADVPKHDDVTDHDSPHVRCTLALYLVFDGALRKQQKELYSFTIQD